MLAGEGKTKLLRFRDLVFPQKHNYYKVLFKVLQKCRGARSGEDLSGQFLYCLADRTQVRFCPLNQFSIIKMIG